MLKKRPGLRHHCEEIKHVVVQSPSTILQELAGFLASGPGPEELVNFQPSHDTQQRAHELLEKQREHGLSWEDEREIEQFQNIELLMRLVKAKMRAGE